ALLVLGGCGERDGPGEQPRVAGRTFLSTDVRREGRPSPLVEGTRIRMTFEGGQVSVQAGCNSLSGDYRVESGVLRVGQVGGTEMGCPEALMAQDQWLAALLESALALALEGDELTLSGRGTVL